MDDPKKRNSRLPFIIVDILHILLGLSIPAAAIYTFIAPEARIRFFPVIFALCAAMCLINGVYLIQHLQRGRKKLGGIFGQFLLTAVFLLMAYVTFRAVGPTP